MCSDPPGHLSSCSPTMSICGEFVSNWYFLQLLSRIIYFTLRLLKHYKKKYVSFFLEISPWIQNISLRKGNLCRRFKGEVIGTFCYLCPRRRGDVLGGYNRGLKEKRPTAHRVSRHAKDSLVACYRLEKLSVRRHKQQEFSFQSFHVRLMYVDCLFLFVIAITVILGGLIYFTHVWGGDLFGYILSNLVPRVLSYPSLWSEIEKRDPGWVWSRGSGTN